MITSSWESDLCYLFESIKKSKIIIFYYDVEKPPISLMVTNGNSNSFTLELNFVNAAILLGCISFESGYTVSAKQPGKEPLFI